MLLLFSGIFRIFGIDNFLRHRLILPDRGGNPRKRLPGTQRNFFTIPLQKTIIYYLVQRTQSCASKMWFFKKSYLSQLKVINYYRPSIRTKCPKICLIIWSDTKSRISIGLHSWSTQLCSTIKTIIIEKFQKVGETLWPQNSDFCVVGG